MINENCPCKKKKCERHGNCDECRKHHAKSKRQRPCEKGKKEAQLELSKGDNKNVPGRRYDSRII